MRLSRCLVILSVLTLVSLIYIQLQVRIYDLAYQGKSKEAEIGRILDDNGNVFYNICTLKSANYLGTKLLSKESGMHFLGSNQIVEMKVPPDNKEQIAMASYTPSMNPWRFLTNIFALKSQAEAKTIK